ncbi:multidrug resistance-associated protein 1-like isoform X2 [Falco rusticolus]|uniref:multidrug resistance-associated protein 1-like isoform X2 n=1 Tax=Falco rusticolus TaxID=120794 RepID=UPI001886954A|nr:multidrug resistance-associated protein 1-like isoform X2 [Falco rusticolus]
MSSPGRCEEADRTLFVGNLESRVREEILYELFLQAGPLTKVTICKDKEGKPKSFGFVCFKHKESVPYAIALLNGIRLYGRPIKVQYRFGSSHSSELNSPTHGFENSIDLYSPSYRCQDPYGNPPFPVTPFPANNSLPHEYSGFQKMKRSPEENAFFFSKLTYSWFSRLISIGYKKPLERDDLFELNESDSPYSVCPNFEKQWRKEIQKSTTGFMASYIKRVLFKKKNFHKPSLILPLWQTFKFLLIKVAFLKVTADILAFMSPQIMKAMIMVRENRPSSYESGYGYAIALFFVGLSQTLLHQLYQRNNMLTAVKIKTAVVGLIYKKALTLANASRQNYTTGEIVNLMSADAQQLMEMTVNINLLWSAPFQIVMAVVFLWKELGPSVLAGVALLLLVIPVNAQIAAKVKNLKKSQMRYSDQRVKLLSEMLHGIKILKLYAWEPAYQRKLMSIREHEVDVLKSSGYLTTYSMLTLTCIPFMVSLATFGVFFHLDGENALTATKVFTSISLFNILRLPLFDLPSVISAVAQTKVSLSRLEDFLCAEDLNPEDVNTNYSGNHAVGFIGASFRWEKNGLPVLKNLNVSIPEGSLVAVVGQVGSGKSSFLSAVLGEMEKLEGTVQRRGSVAYVSQQAWIQNDSLQENILFGANLNMPYYKLVLESCALLPDLEQLLNGDQTEIGERGVNISGGQKQRVSLARAVYSNADLYLLDDTLSAVDVHIGKHLFEKLIGPSGLLKSKTRILVTHNVTLLPHTDLIIVMEKGRISQMGTYQELISKRANFTELIQVFSAEHTNEKTTPVEVISSKEGGQLGRSLQQRELLKYKDSSFDQWKTLTNNKEKVTTGGMKISVVLKYLQAFNWRWMWLTIAAYLAQNALAIGQNLWLSTWTAETAKISDFTEWKQSQNYKLLIYGLLGFIQGLLICCGAYVLTKGSLSASRTLHHQLLDDVLHLPLQCFETNPVGQIINRFTKDLFIVDIRFHYYLRTWLNCTLDVIGTILVITSASPLFIVVVIPLGCIYFTIQRYYIASSRQIRRLAGASHSPVISHFSETLAGRSTIRGFGHQGRFIRRNNDVVYENLVYFYNNVISNRWLSVRLEFLGNLMVFFAAVFVVLAGNTVSSSTVGLSISYALNIIQSLNFWVRKACEIETNAVSIERICEFAKMDKEKPWIMSKRPPEGWPDRGIIEFVNYKAQYRKDLGLALDDVSFQTRSKEKVGIVGRTGAGKSTLTNCLFRVLEGSQGKIIIDGIDISTIGLHDLRGNLNIIPQDPILFSGTVQSNLDPLGKHSDLELWEVLELCDLKVFVQSLPKKLLHEISEGGENLSVGQRQLVCLARALLRKTKILVLDEATASVDMETDNLVQSTIKREFYNCTVLTVAHRLHTVMDSERVLVLDAGRILEYDTPHNLLQRKGAFSEMVAEAGIRT